METAMDGDELAGTSSNVVPFKQRTPEHVSTQQRHRLIMYAILQNRSIAEIAVGLGVHPNTVTRIVNTDIFKSELAQLRARSDEKVVEATADVNRWIKNLCSTKVKSTLEGLLDGAKTQDRLKADICFDLLDRAGHAAPEKHEHSVLDYARLVQAAYERRQAMATLPTNDIPVSFADVPGYVPPPSATEAEPKQFAFEGFGEPDEPPLPLE